MKNQAEQLLVFVLPIALRINLQIIESINQEGEDFIDNTYSSKRSPISGQESLNFTNDRIILLKRNGFYDILY
jgi:hypothetical protein